MHNFQRAATSAAEIIAIDWTSLRHFFLRMLLQLSLEQN